jgi:hypothetical protein
VPLLVPPDLTAHEIAAAEWAARPLPRPPMTADSAIHFAFDWPRPGIGLFPACAHCSRPARNQKAAIRHMERRHPGWLDEWNGRLRAEGIVADD